LTAFATLVGSASVPALGSVAAAGRAREVDHGAGDFDGARSSAAARNRGLRSDPQPRAPVRAELRVYTVPSRHGPEHAGEATRQRNDRDAFAARSAMASAQRYNGSVRPGSRKMVQAAEPKPHAGGCCPAC
jgi:hypothetical protein